VPRWPARSVDERFWALVQIGAPDECWPWRGGVNADGYGVFKLAAGEVVYAHRLAFAFANGELPTQRCACHTCDPADRPGDIWYRRCCNPAHLYDGSDADNARDVVRRKRRTWGVAKPLAVPEHVAE